MEMHGSFFRLNLVWRQFRLPHCLWLWCIWTYAEANVSVRLADKPWLKVLLVDLLWEKKILFVDWKSTTYKLSEQDVRRRPAPKLEKQAEDLTEFPHLFFFVIRQYIYLSLVINSLDVLTVHAVLLMLEENSLQSCRTLCMNACTSWPSILLSISCSSPWVCCTLYHD